MIEDREKCKPLRDEMREIARSRAQYYRILASVFAVEPNRSTLQSLLSANREPEESSPKEGALEQGLLSEIQELGIKDIDIALAEIRVEYAQLFVGPRHKLAAPFESMYVGKHNRLYSDVTRKVRACYEKSGFTVIAKNHIPDDYIAYELEFMARLCSQLSEDNEVAQKALRAQKQFLEEHLLLWVGSFASRIIESGCSKYYSAWARFLVGFIEADTSALRNCHPAMQQQAQSR